MIKSMTGYGKAEIDSDNLSVEIEVRTLNSKFLDLNLRIPKELNQKELDIRRLVSEELSRGKVSLSIDISYKAGSETKVSYNETLFATYFNQLKSMAEKVGATDQEIFRMAVQSPEVSITDSEKDLNDQDWSKVEETLREALGKCDNFRTKEGQVLEGHIKNYLHQIADLLSKIETLEPDRIVAIRERISQNLAELQSRMSLDQNRLEQELIFYLERLDISEEVDRLKSHIQHFEDTMKDPSGQGKKLGFISQELGREINTIGSKANQAEIQKLVVAMKDELEKIKEQLYNIL